MFVIGGSRDIFAPISKALFEHEESSKKTLYISVNHSLDTKPLLSADLANAESSHKPLLD